MSFLRTAACSLAVVAVAACTSAPGNEDVATDTNAVRAGGLVQVTGFGKNPGALTMWEHVPANLAPNAPVVVVLHGCMTSALDIADTGWNDLADQRGFVVVYPQQSYFNNGVFCFNWADSMGFGNDDAERGGGESESVAEMTRFAMKRHHSDPNRVYVAGFSAGAAMAVDLAAVYPDLYVAAASFAGVPYGCAGSIGESLKCMIPGIERAASEHARRVTAAFPGYSGRRPKISIWQGSADTVVYPKNQTELAKQWTTLHGVGAADRSSDVVDGAAHTAWKNASGDTVVETYRIDGMWHGFPVDPSNGCGKVAEYAFDHGICGASRAGDFFSL